MTTCLIALGSNLGDRATTLDAAVDVLSAAPGVKVVGCSAWQMTLPVGGSGPQPKFLNGAALIETSRDGAELHSQLQEIETRFGRERCQRWGNRTLDLDLLLYGDSILDTPTLSVPHPRMSFRRFVLEPAVEIAGAMVHPTIGSTLEDLLDQSDTGADCVAIVSSNGAARDELANRLSKRFGVKQCTPSAVDERLWPAASTSWLALSEGPNSNGRPKLSILLDLPASREAGRGPCLRIATTDRDAVECEAFAAVEAVWPRLGHFGGERLQ